MLIIILGFIITILCIFYSRYIDIEKPDYVFTFENTMGSYKVPIVSFNHNGKTVNFIIDSGSTHSIINASSLDEFNCYKIDDKQGSVFGIDGNKITTNLVGVTISKDNHDFHEVFQVLPVPGIDKLNNTENIKVHGLLGSTFLKRYRFHIDYKRLEAYCKK